MRVKIKLNDCMYDVTKFEKWYDKEYCLAAVKKNGYALQYVNKNLFEIIIED